MFWFSSLSPFCWLPRHSLFWMSLPWRLHIRNRSALSFLYHLLFCLVCYLLLNCFIPYLISSWYSHWYSDIIHFDRFNFSLYFAVIRQVPAPYNRLLAEFHTLYTISTYYNSFSMQYSPLDFTFFCSGLIKYDCQNLNSLQGSIFWWSLTIGLGTLNVYR